MNPYACGIYDTGGSGGGSGPTGSGTLNYIAKWTPSGSALGNSQIYDDATSVGVGTATLTYYFNVAKNQNANTTVNVSNTTQGTASRAGFLATSEDNSLAAYAYSSTFANSYFANNAVLYSGQRILRFIADADGVGNGKMTWGIGSGTSTNQLMELLATGELGIGLTAPTARLQVKGSGATSGTYGLIVQNSSATQNMVILDDGGIGMGVTSGLLAKLQIKELAADPWSYPLVVGTNAVANMFSVSYGGITEAVGTLRAKDGSGAFQGGATFEVASDSPSHIARFGSTTTPTVLDIRFNGLVGITNDSPTYPLHIKNTDFKQIALYRNSANGDGPSIAFNSLGNYGVETEFVRIGGIGNDTNGIYLLETRLAGTFQASMIYREQTTSANGGGLRLQNIGMSTTERANAVLDVRSSFSDANNLALFYNNSTSLVHWMQNNGNVYWNYNNTGKSVIGAYIASPGAQLVVQGSGSTSATYGLIVQNSTPTPSFKVRDDKYIIQSANNAAIADGDLANSEMSWYIDEGGNNIIVKVKYSGGTVKTATIALV